MMPVFPIRLILMILPVVIAIVVLMVLTATDRRQKMFGRQGVAWFVTSLMIVAAIGIGYSKAHASNAVEPAPDLQQVASPALETIPPGYNSRTYVRDDAGVLSDDTVTELNARNQQLYEKYGAVIGVVTCNYGRDDLYNYALKRAEDMNLSDRSFIVVLDISGDNYWLVQGAGLVNNFTDEDCSEFAYGCMERYFAAGDYDSAVIMLTMDLEGWYRDRPFLGKEAAP